MQEPELAISGHPHRTVTICVIDGRGEGKGHSDIKTMDDEGTGQKSHKLERFIFFFRDQMQPRASVN